LIDDLERAAAARVRPEFDALLAEPDRSVAGMPRAATLRMVPGDLPSVQGRVNGRSMTLLLDTGATHVYFGGRGARRAQVYLPAAAEIDIVTPGDRSPWRLCVFDTLQLGPMAFGPGVAALPVREAGGGQRHECVVGGSVLSHFRVTFDFKGREVRLAPHGGPAAAESLFTEAKVNGRPFWLLVDSGASRLVLEPWAAVELGLMDEEEAARHRKRDGASGGGRRTRLRLDAVEVAGTRFRAVKALVVDTFTDVDADGVRPAGLLGLAAFGDRIWTLDYGTRRLVVEE
jgi:predicted aspartyl protease